MVKNVFYFLITFCLSNVLMAQGTFDFDQADTEKKLMQTNAPVKFRLNKDKAFGDTLYYQDFADSIPEGYTIGNYTSGGFDWMWLDTAPGGQFSTHVGALASSTSDNGYMAMRADLYNTPLTWTFHMDSWFTSPPIAIPPVGSVLISFQHALRYCCKNNDEIVLEVRTNGVNWSTYDATGNQPFGRAPNETSPNGELVSINVSADLAFADTIYYRFRMTGASHYYWMVDDVTITEGPSNGLELEDYHIKFNQDSLLFSPIYSHIPQSQLRSIRYEGFSRNYGSAEQTNVYFDVEVYNDSTWTGNPGSGFVFAESQIVDSSVPSLRRDTTGINTTQPGSFSVGYYRHEFSLRSDSVNQLIVNRTPTYHLAVTDTVFALDKGPAYYDGGTEPPPLVGWGQSGDRVANLFVLEKPATITSISVYITDRKDQQGNSLVQGVEFSPRVWSFTEQNMDLSDGKINTTDLDAAISANPVASSSQVYVVDSTDFNNWITLPISPAVKLQPGAYYAGVEELCTTANCSSLFMSFGRDRSAEDQAPILSFMYFLNDTSNPRWIVSKECPAIRMNIEDEAIGMDEKTSASVQFNLYPNPNNGEFKLHIETAGSTDYTINIRNTLGQLIYTETVTASGKFQKTIDLSGESKGIYLLSIENNQTYLAKKIILK
ncbi:MAG: T9SS type A sorting domain-containing protein [Vicingaceae bacterium]